ncbi:MAG: 3-oxoadipate enol-lactonase [Pseudomonadota bacterium]
MTEWITHKAVGLHWREDGDPLGAPVLFLNSLGTDLRLWDAVICQLSGARLIRMDTRGHGLSDAPEGPYDLAMLTEDVAALMLHLDLRDIILVGVSLGGMVAQNLAAAHPDRVERLLLSNTALRMGTSEMWSGRVAQVEENGIASIADAVLDRWFAPGFHKDATFALWRNMLIRTPRAGYLGCCAAVAAADLSSTAPQIACPTQVIGGSEDGASPPDLVRALSQAIPGATYVELNGIGHLPMIEAPGRFSSILQAMIEEHANARAL